MTNLEQAARQALEALGVATTPLAKDRQEVLEAIASLRQALEQQANQEPVLWGCKFNKGNRLDTFYTKGAAERFVEGSLRNGADVSLVGLYTEPPQRQPLTDDEIFCLYRTVWSPDENANEVLAFARAIEAAHGIGEKK